MALAELRRWMASTGTTRPALADLLGKARQWAYQVVDGDSLPGLEAAEFLERHTHGAVRVADWRRDYNGDLEQIEVPAAPRGRPPLNGGQAAPAGEPAPKGGGGIEPSALIGELRRTAQQKLQQAREQAVRGATRARAKLKALSPPKPKPGGSKRRRRPTRPPLPL